MHLFERHGLERRLVLRHVAAGLRASLVLLSLGLGGVACRRQAAPSAPATAMAKPASWSTRVVPADALGVFFDGDATPRATVPTAQLATTRTVADVIRAGASVRSVMAHEEGGDDVWFRAAELPKLNVHLNRRGKIKIEDAGGNGSVPGDGNGQARAHGVQWFEVRTAASPRIEGEPN